ncbi:MAG: rod shape-determining protein RodA [Alphaproteobacteria bacterium]|jgi:rod shape determining protein RodA|nr:rod shape-determining protein RodA [Alphaproteobacteria bacterium]WPX98684.1 Rod shape-determining protein RodA [Candidatus Megaera polyxenophila]
MSYSTKEKFVAKLQKIPFSIPFLITTICIYGFIILYSAAGGAIEPWAYRQIIIFSIFMPLALIISMVDTRFIHKCSYFIYFFVLLFLIAVAIIGKTAMGATRWIDLGVFHIQPSEPSKIAIVLMLARYFHNTSEENISSIYNLIPPIIGVLVPTFLIIKQPDLGTGIITLIVATIIFFAAGVKKLYFVIAGIGSLTLLPILWSLLHNYQKNRVLIFLNPDREPLGAGYNIIQSKIAIGSGGFWGKGLLNGTQSHLNFLPEYTTDFIFSFLTEELGFVGGLILIILYFMLILSSLAIAINTKPIFTKLMVIGLTSIFFSHIFINIGMVMGMLPVVGVPLPFISYGGTMMVSMLISFGLIMNASLHQHTNFHSN